MTKVKKSLVLKVQDAVNGLNAHLADGWVVEYAHHLPNGDGPLATVFTLVKYE